MDAATIVAIVAALVAVAAAGGTVYLLARTRRRTYTLEQELERGKARFDEAVTHEIEERATELEQALKLARAASVSSLVEEERRIAEERRRDVIERERDANERLAGALTEVERRVEQRLAGWGAELEQLQESLAEELTRIAQRLAQLSTEAEAKIAEEGDRLQATVDEQRALVGKLREDFGRSTEEVAKAAAADLEQHSGERRRALHEVAERLRRRERELQEQVEHELAEALQRVGTMLGDVEHRQVEQLKRVVSREATRYAEAAAQQFDATFRTSREEAAKRLGRELDLAIERFAREAEGVLAERVEHLAEAAVARVDARIEELTRRLDELGARR
jgi:hypothetical protein